MCLYAVQTQGQVCKTVTLTPLQAFTTVAGRDGCVQPTRLSIPDNRFPALFDSGSGHNKRGLPGAVQGLLLGQV